MLKPELMALQVAYAQLELAGFGDGAVILLPPEVAEGFTVIANMSVIRVPGLAEPMLGLPPRAFEKANRPVQRWPATQPSKRQPGTRRRGLEHQQLVSQVVQAHAAAVQADDPTPRKTVAAQFGYTPEYISRLLKGRPA